MYVGGKQAARCGPRGAYGPSSPPLWASRPRACGETEAEIRPRITRIPNRQQKEKHSRGSPGRSGGLALRGGLRRVPGRRTTFSTREPAGYSPVEPVARSVRRDMAELVAGYSER